MASAEPVNGGGYTSARRLRTRLADGRTLFIKAAVNTETADWLRAESRIYEALEGAPFMARRFAFHDAGGETFLALEDLSAAHWPPPWTLDRVAAVQEALAEMRRVGRRVRSPLPLIEEDTSFASWGIVAADPRPFLSLGLCTEPWLAASLPALLQAEHAAPLAGEDLLHLDVRSDNICFRTDGSAVLVDWNWACRGNGVLDTAGWLPSLSHEAGLEPEAVLPEASAFAALLAGFWAARAGTPPPIGAPRVREVQRNQLAVALPWAARASGLPPPDGVGLSAGE